MATKGNVVRMNARNRNLKAEVVELTPQLAAEYLETNVKHQRHLTRNRVEQYAFDIREGNFVLSGQPIIFNEEGHMVDGQHRCAAVIMAEQSIPAILVVRGVEPETFVALDTGKQRTASDVLAIEGYHYVHNLSSCARMVLNFERYGELHPQRYRLPPSEILRLVRNEPRLEPTVISYEKQRIHITPLGIGGRPAGFHMVLLRAGAKPAAIEDFMQALIYGEGLKRTDPVYQYRAGLLENVRNPVNRMTRKTKDARLIKTWNAWLTGNVGPNVTKFNALREEYPVLLTKDA